MKRLSFIVFLSCSLKMIIRQGRFVEYSVFGKETSVDWTIISDAKGILCLILHYNKLFVVFVYSQKSPSKEDTCVSKMYTHTI